MRAALWTCAQRRSQDQWVIRQQEAAVSATLETAEGAGLWMRALGAETCKQSFRGAVLVPITCGWDILAAVVMRRHQEAHSGHLGSPEPVLLWAHETNQRGRRRGSDS